MMIRRLLYLATAFALPAQLCSGQALLQRTPEATQGIVAEQKTYGPVSGLVTLPGHIVPALQSARDLGSVSPDLSFEHMFLQLKRSPAQQAALDQAIGDLHDEKSATFHQWMTAAEFGQKFGATDAQIEQVSGWLASNGFVVETANEARTMIAFSGTASQLQSAFHTEIHNVGIGRTEHVSNTSEPQVPAAMANLIQGVKMSDFMPHPLVRGGRSVKRNAITKKFEQVGTASPDFTVSYQGDQLELVAPGDFATIYNITPAWRENYRGAGQTVAVVEDTLMKAADIATFRKAFGLSQYAGTFVQELPKGALPCTTPGVNGDESEAALDAEWAGATAPDAAVVLAACANSRTEFGGLLATMNLLSQKTPPQTISMSYGECEANMGAIQLNEFNTIFEQAVAEGVTVFVSSGDDGSAGCDPNQSYAKSGLHTSGFATTPYNVAVGGTDFYDYIQGSTNQYWSKTNSLTFSSALSYVPEKTWNDSCADSATIAFTKFTQGYGPTGLCNNYPGYQWVTTASGSGGSSSVYAKPAWQTVAGVPNDSLRDIPDVSLFAANGFWGHALVYCDSDKASYGVPCDFSNIDDVVLDIAGGTSFASPAMAGIFTLVTQKYGRQGNADIGLYKLAAAEYGTQKNPINASNCNSTNGNKISSGCVFNDVTQGSIDVPCYGTVNCYGAGSGYGLLSLDSSQFTSAYPTTTGWDFATGLGTINASNLLNDWSQISPAISKTTTQPPAR